MAENLLDLKLEIIVAKEAAVFTTEQNLRDTAQQITNEYHTVPAATPYRIRLDEQPDRESGVTVPAYTESAALPTQAGEFYVDWVMGYVYFYSTDAKKVVNPQYFGTGSVVDAADLNKITQELVRARDVTNRLRPSAQNTPTTTINIEPGIFDIGTVQVNYLGRTSIRLGTAGEYEVSALSTGYYNKLLFTIDSVGLLKKTEGAAASTESAVVTPSIPIGEMPICIVTVQDDGTGTAGTIKNIESGHIQDIRSFVKVPPKQHQHLVFYYQDLPDLNDVFLDGFYFGETVKVDKIHLFARVAPSGGSVTVGLMKNGSLTGETATLGQGARSQATMLSSEIEFKSTDKFSLKITAIDPNETAAGLSIYIYHYAT